jgi:glucose/arabinose dehydrogenase
MTTTLRSVARIATLMLPAALANAAVPSDLALVPVATGFNTPVAMAAAGDKSGRLFVAELPGRVRVIRNGAVLPAALLDLSPLVSTSSCGGECGLLGLAFDPAFATNRYVYPLHNDAARNNLVLRHVVPAGSDVADVASRTNVITITQGTGQHNGGDLKFGPDGMLYISVGDAATGGAPAQQLSTLRGKILRIDVHTLPYTIPAGNPYAADAPGANTRDEIWHVGLRNPWRFSFDRASGDLWIADVGGDGGPYEEFNRAPSGSSAVNFGWNCYSGTTQLGCSLAAQTAPEIQVTTAQLGCAAVGGFRYPGPVAMMRGMYVYADYCSGRVWGATRTTAWTTQLLLQHDGMLTSFGEDENGWLYLAEHANPATIYRLYSERIFASGMEQ